MTTSQWIWTTILPFVGVLAIGIVALFVFVLVCGLIGDAWTRVKNARRADDLERSIGNWERAYEELKAENAVLKARKEYR